MNGSKLLLIKPKSNLIFSNYIAPKRWSSRVFCYCSYFILCLWACSITYAQNIKADAIEYIGVRSNCIMELNATNKALLLPRIVNVSGSISSPLRGMIVYDSTANTLSYYNGSVWRQLDGSNNIYNTDGTLTGGRTVTMNNNTLLFNSANGNFIFNPTGTGKMGIGTNAPYSNLDVLGDIYLTRHSNNNHHASTERGIRRIGQKSGNGLDGFNGLEFEVGASPAGAAENAGSIKFYTWGSSISGTREVARIDPYGNVGIGTATPAQKIDVNGTIKSEKLYLNNLDMGSTSDKFLVLGNDKYVRTIDASLNNIYTADGTLTGNRTVSQNGRSLTITGGNMNLNTVITSDLVFSPDRDAVIQPIDRTGDNPYNAAALTIKGANAANRRDAMGGNLVLKGGTGGKCSQNQANRSGGDVIIIPGANLCSDVYARIILAPPQQDYAHPTGTRGGNVGIGTNNPQPNMLLQVDGATCNGSSWMNSSDRRLKKDIVPLSYGLKEILQLQPKFYEYKSKPGVREVGFIAQEVKTLIPELVKGEEGDISKSETLSLNYANLTAVLVNAIQEQQKEIQGQQKLIQGQQKAIELLQQEMAEIKKAMQRNP